MKTMTGYDVIIFGGGLCGYSTAMTLARAEKRKILLVEPKPVLGWETTWAYDLNLEIGISPLGDEIGSAIEKVGGRKENRIDAPITEITLQEMLQKEKIDLLYYCSPLGVVKDENGINNVAVAGKSGIINLQGNYYIDATENAFLLQSAGLEVKKPNQQSSLYSLMLNKVPNTGKLPSALDGEGEGEINEIKFKPTIWNGEVAVEFVFNGTSIAQGRNLCIDVLEKIRGEVKELNKAAATHSGHALMPLVNYKVDSSSPIEVPEVSNLFGAGPWTGAAVPIDSIPAERIKTGENAGKKINGFITNASKAKPETVKSFELHFAKWIESDVLVCGGGPGGSIAAISAARQGVKVRMFDASTCLGGAATGGAIHNYCVGVAGGLQDEIDDKVRELTPLFVPEGSLEVGGFHPEVKKIVLQQLAEEEGVKIDFETTAFGARTDSVFNRIRAVEVVGTDGGQEYQANVVIDSTGDGDVAAMAGASYRYGRETDNIPHAYSQPSGVIANGKRLYHLNFDAGHFDPTDVKDSTQARCHGVAQYRRDQYKEEDRLLYMAPIIGIRSSRFIDGEYQLSLSDELEWRKFPDAISYMRSFHDNHEFDFENETDQAMNYVWIFGGWQKKIGCEVPYRCLLPQKIEGLLIACRALSMSNDAHYGFRMQRDLQRVGEAAGTAAALSVKEKITPRQLDYRKIQTLLRETGGLDSEDWVKNMPEPENPEDFQEFCENNIQRPLYHLLRSGQKGRDKLTGYLSDNKRYRYWAALGLATVGDIKAAESLIECVKEKYDEKPEGHKTAPLWWVAIGMLGILQARQAVPVLIKILEESKPEIDVVMTTVRALGRIGDNTAGPTILALLERPDISLTRPAQKSCGGVEPILLDVKWQLELLVAETLQKLGNPQPKIVERYLNDPRAFVRRYAQKVRRTF